MTILEALRADVETLLPHRAASHCCLALSGGVDSIVLLDRLAAVRDCVPELVLRALHVDHGLNRDATQWSAAACAAAEARGVPCEVLHVTVGREAPEGLEAAAREARHAALCAALGDGEVLVTAHHADDQLETVMLALVRGAGVAGLAAMPLLTSLTRGWHWRPLLRFTRADVLALARERELTWCEDPANRDLRHDRNFLRHVVLPQLHQRWPAASLNAVRAARHLAEAASILDEVALADLRSCAVGPCLDVAALAGLDPAHRRQLLRFWLRLKDLRAPSDRRLRAIERDLLVAAPDRTPVIAWERGASLRRYRGLLYAVSDVPAADVLPGRITWLRSQRLDLPCGLGALRWRASEHGAFDDARLPAAVEVRFRTAGEHVRLPGRSHTTPLGEVMRRHGVLPWMRAQVPLVYAGDELIAIGGEPLGEPPVSCAAVRLELEWSGQPAWREARR